MQLTAKYVYIVFEDKFKLCFKKGCLQHVWRHAHIMFEEMFTKYFNKSLFRTVKKDPKWFKIDQNDQNETLSF